MSENPLKLRQIHHVEFWASDLQEIRERLSTHGVAVTERTLPDKHQLHMTDPDGIQVNLNFPLAEVQKG